MVASLVALPARVSDVAVVVVSWNTREALAECLRSLTGERVVVVDNASTDGTPEMVRADFGEVELVETGENLGFGPAANLGARRTDARWLAVSNADVAVRPGAITALVRAAELDWRAGVLAPRLVLPDGSTQHSVHPFPTLRVSIAANLDRAGDRLALEGAWDPERPRLVDWALGAFLLVRREAWNAVGGFDDAQWMYAEDLDLGWRMRAAGWRTRYVPEAIVEHRESAATAAAWGAARTARARAATYAWMARRRRPALSRAVAAVNVAGALVRALTLTPRVRRDRAETWRRDRELRWAREHAIGLSPRRAALAAARPGAHAGSGPPSSASAACSPRRTE